MFKVRSLRSGNIRTVFAVVGSKFLFWKDYAWVFEDIEHYVPEDAVIKKEEETDE